MPVDLGGLMTKSIAIWPSLNGRVRLAAESSDGSSVWRNGGPEGNSPAALQLDPTRDTDLLRGIVNYVTTSYGAQIESITSRVVIFKVKPWRLFSVLQYLGYVLSRSGGRTYIRIPSRHPKMVAQ